MAALLGMALGATARAIGERGMANYQQKQEHDRMLGELYVTHPWLAATQEGKKNAARILGPENAKALEMVGQHTQQMMGAMPQPGGGGMEPAGASPAQAPSGGMAQAAAGAGGAQGQPQMPQRPPWMKDSQDPRYWEQYLAHSAQFKQQHPNWAQDPTVAANVKAQDDYANRMLAVTQKSQQYQQTQQRLTQEHEDVTALRKQTLESQQQSRAETAALREQSLQATEQARKDTADLQKQIIALKKTRDETQRQNQVSQLAKSIDAQRDKILADFQKTPSPAVKARVDGYNASAEMFYRKHATAGAPTLLKYSVGPAGYIESGTPTVEAVPPQYGTNKKTGQSGWFDANNNFYPESGAAAPTEVAGAGAH
jgi:hypothetical protein